MVRLFRGAVNGRGRHIGRPPFMNRPMRPMRPVGFEQEIPPFARTMGRGRLLRPGPPRPHLPPPPRMGPGLLPHRPPMPPHPSEMRPHHRPPLGLRPGILPPMLPPRPMMPPGPLLRRPMRPGPGALIRGRGGMIQRGFGPKRLGSSINGRTKKAQKRKEKTEEMEVNKPWVTEALKLEIQKKYQLYNIAKEKKNDSDWQIYKDQRILVGKITNTAKIEYIGSHPEAGEFFCESCDRGWKTQEQLSEHIAEHEVCGRDGCMFTGHPKIILKHKQLQHDSGLYLRIATENPEDVAKWISDRKSRFPTKENIEKNKAQKQEMFDRGERIPKQGKPFQNRDTSGSRSNRFQRQSNETNSGPKNVRQNRLPQKKNNLSYTQKWRDPEAWKGDLPRFAGTAAFTSTEVVSSSDVMDGVHYSDEEDIVETKVVKKVIDKPLLSGVLASLVMDYGSDSSDNEAENRITSESAIIHDQRKTIELTLLHKPDETVCPAIEVNELKTIDSVQEENEFDSGPEECAVDREDKSNTPLLSSESGSHSKLNDNELNQNKHQESDKAVQQRTKVPFRQPLMQRHQLSLLEKLLKNEIRHERNVILQSVRYVVKNKFFDSGNLMK